MRDTPFAVYGGSLRFALVLVLCSLAISPLVVQGQSSDLSVEIRKVNIRLASLRRTIAELPEAAHAGTLTALILDDNSYGSQHGWAQGYRHRVEFYYSPVEEGQPGTVQFVRELDHREGEDVEWEILYSSRGVLQWARLRRHQNVTEVYFTSRGDVMRYSLDGLVQEAPRAWVERTAIEKQAARMREYFRLLRFGQSDD